MRRVRKVVVAGLVMAVAAAAATNATVYKNSGQGFCGNELLNLNTTSVTFCAIVCSQASQCSGFSYKEKLSLKYCQLHQTLSQPDEASETTCYLPRTEEEETTTASPQQTTATTTTTTTEEPSISTSTATTTTTEEPSTAATTSTTTTTTTTTESVTVAPTSIANKNYVNINQKQKCAGNGAAIGIFQAGSYFLICTLAPNGMSFNVGEPEDECDTPNNHIICMNTDCGPESIIMGFRQARFPSQGPCSNGFNGNGNTKLDTNDCHTVSGPMQVLASKGSSWSQWRVCGGDSNNLYVMNKAEVTENIVGVWTIDSITCCRIRRI